MYRIRSSAPGRSPGRQFLHAVVALIVTIAWVLVGGVVGLVIGLAIAEHYVPPDPGPHDFSNPSWRWVDVLMGGVVGFVLGAGVGLVARAWPWLRREWRRDRGGPHSDQSGGPSPPG